MNDIEYFVFDTEAEARDFFIYCLSKGVYVSLGYEADCIYVKVDITKTLEAKNETRN